MKVIELRSSNFKRLEAVEIHFPPEGGTFEICGGNGAGKTSVLDSLCAAIAGAKETPEQPIRRGASRATVHVDLGEYQIKREWRANGKPTLTLLDASGQEVKSPQAVLDGFWDKYTFDPMEFARQKPSEQAALLRRIAGLDFSALDRQRETVFSRRTEVNRDLAKKRAVLAGMPVVPATEPVSLADLMAKLKAANTHNDRRRAVGVFLSEHNTQVAREEREIESLREKLRAAIARRTEAEGKRDEASQQLEAIGPEVETDAIQAEIGAIETINARAAQYQARAAAAKAADDLDRDAQALTDELGNIDGQRARMLADAKMPVPGLSLDGDTVTFGGIPFSQISTSEQIRASLAIGSELNRSLRLIRIKDGSLLDEASLRIVAEWAAEKDYQVLVERVAKSTVGAGVVIEEGAVKEMVPS